MIEGKELLYTIENNILARLGGKILDRLLTLRY